MLQQLRDGARPSWTRLGLLPLTLLSAPAIAQSSNVRISNLSDVPFGNISNVSVDAVRSQSVCVFANTAANRYRITAVGSGANGAFTLTSGASVLALEVQWSALSGQTSGTLLSPNQPLTGQVSSATQQTCNAGPAASASFVAVLRSAALSGAIAGSYNGSVTLIVGAE